MPLNYDRPRIAPAARLHVVCPRHPEAKLITYVMLPDGFDYVESGFMGVTAFEEFVTDAELSAETLDYAAEIGLTAPTAVDKDGQGHARMVYTCPRPSCNYNPKVSDDGGPDGLRARTLAFMRGMVESGIAEATITNIDGPWRPA